jgi:hypothetical protein
MAQVHLYCMHVDIRVVHAVLKKDAVVRRMEKTEPKNAARFGYMSKSDKIENSEEREMCRDIQLAKYSSKGRKMKRMQSRSLLRHRCFLVGIQTGSRSSCSVGLRHPVSQVVDQRCCRKGPPGNCRSPARSTRAGCL